MILIIFSSRNTTMHQNIEKILSLNASCVHLFSLGHVKASFGVLRTAMEELRRMSYTQTPIATNSSVLRICPTKIDQNFTELTSSSEVYQCGLGVILNDDVVDNQTFLSENDVHLLTAALLFNMALLHHWKGVNCPQTGLGSSHKAISIYRLALAACGRMDATGDDDDKTFLEVITGNNMACRLADMYEHDHLERCVQWTVPRAHELGDDCVFFHTNLIIWLDARRRPAATA